jgi:hypothetical protein
LKQLELDAAMQKAAELFCASDGVNVGSIATALSDSKSNSNSSSSVAAGRESEASPLLHTASTLSNSFLNRTATQLQKAAQQGPFITPASVRAAIKQTMGKTVSLMDAEEMLWIVDEGGVGYITGNQFTDMVNTVYERGWLLYWNWHTNRPHRVMHDLAQGVGSGQANMFSINNME